jgi:uncharacterized protein (TIGR02266 family)
MVKANKKLVPRDDRITINHEFSSVDAFIAEYVTNISRSGVFIKTKQPLPVGTKVNLKFTVIMDELETMEGVGEVVRLQNAQAGEEPGMGVVFVTLTSHSQDLIAKLITRRRMGRAASIPPVTPSGKPVRTSTARGTPPPPPGPAPVSQSAKTPIPQRLPEEPSVPIELTTRKRPPPPPKKK